MTEKTRDAAPLGAGTLADLRPTEAAKETANAARLNASNNGVAGSRKPWRGPWTADKGQR